MPRTTTPKQFSENSLSKEGVLRKTVYNVNINGAKNILFKFLGPENVSPLSVDNGVVVRGVDLSLFKFDSSKLNRRRIPVALA